VRGLHVVGVSDDGTQLLLAASPDAERASHWLALDGRLRAAVKGELRTGEKPESALSPKEIQARLRSGETVEAVAKAARVPQSRILPFAAPVISERERVLEEAQATIPRRDRGPSGRPLGEAVTARLAAVAGLKPETVQWSARRRDDGNWIVELGYSARGGARRAEWLWRPAERDLRAVGAAASRLSAPEPGAAQRSGGPARPAAAPRRAGGGRRAASGRPAPTTGKPAATATTTGKPAKRAVGRRPVRPRTTGREPEPRPVEPTPPPAAAGPNSPPGTPVNGGSRGRASVPSWSDVLFGVTGPAAPPPAKRRRTAAGTPAAPRRKRA
jgi:hypothetical protein